MLFHILIGLKLQVNNTNIYIISQCYLKLKLLFKNIIKTAVLKKIKYIIFKIILRQVSKAFYRDLLEQFLKSLYFVM